MVRLLLFIAISVSFLRLIFGWCFLYSCHCLSLNSLIVELVFWILLTLFAYRFLFLDFWVFWGLSLSNHCFVFCVLVFCLRFLRSGCLIVYAWLILLRFICLSGEAWLWFVMFDNAQGWLLSHICLFSLLVVLVFTVVFLRLFSWTVVRLVLLVSLLSYVWLWVPECGIL